MLCNPCQQKATIQVPGSCTKCSAMTTHFAYKLCNACSQQLQECEWCQIPLQAGTTSPTATPQPTPYFVTVTDKDAGKTISGLRRGEQIHVILDEDQYSWREWDVDTKNSSSNFKLLQRGQFVPDPQNPQYGTRTFVFEVVSTGQGAIKMHECQRSWSWGWIPRPVTLTPVVGGKTWDATFQAS